MAETGDSMVASSQVVIQIITGIRVGIPNVPRAPLPTELFMAVGATTTLPSGLADDFE